jgi:hypothetical protein
LVDDVEAVRLDEALGEAERHRGVVRPLARRDPERPPTDKVGNRLE